MTSYVDPVSLIACRPRYATHIIALLDHYGFYGSPGKQFESRSQAGWSCSDDNCSLILVH